MIERERIQKRFLEYVSHYDLQDPKIALKVSHTGRVASLAERIASESGFSGEEISLAWAMGMLHDIGRFEQLRLYGTFQDAISIDHALCGAEFLFQKGHIREYIEDDSYDSLIEKAIRHHSVYRLPEGLTEGELKFCNLLRDADKIDILRVNVEVPLEEIYNASSEEVANAEVTEAVMEAFLEKHAINHALKKTVIDRSVGHASLVFELVYPVSFTIVEEQGYLQQVLTCHSRNEKTKQQYVILSACMWEFIKEKKKGKQ